MRPTSLIAALAGALVVAAGCRFDPSGVAGDDDDVIDADTPPGPDASADAPPGACDPVADTVCLDPNTLQSCVGGALQTEVCAMGCVDSPGRPHCVGPQPSNGVDLDLLDGATGTFDVANGKHLVFDTGTGVIFDCGAASFVRSAGTGLKNGIRFETVPGQGTGISLGVFAFTSLRVRGGGQITAVGPNALAWLSAGEVRIEDRVAADGGDTACSIEAACGFVPGDRICAGPGGFSGGGENMGGQGPGGGMAVAGGGPVFEFGGGGAGFGSPGGHGGSNSGGDGGVIYGAVGCEPLIGGSGGGGGGSDAPQEAGRGGGGGGAVQITSLTEVRFSGMGGIDVGGAGGGGAVGPGTQGGGGAGSGGAVLLEAPELDLDGTLAANGGGGGAGNGILDLEPDLPGEDGAFSQAVAKGGTGSYKGGDGAAGSNIAKDGDPSGTDLDGTGGGGGGVGRLCLRAAEGGLLLGNLVSSPGTVNFTNFIR